MIKYHAPLFLFLLSSIVSCLSCSSSDVKDAIDVLDGVPRKTIDTSKLGINAFVNDARFGTVRNQFLEVRDTLRLNSVRVLFAWNDGVQPSPSASPNMGFYDSIVNQLPNGVDVLIIVTGTPSWMADPANWIEGNPRKTFAQRWAGVVAARYGSNPKVVGFQVWNEPNMPGRSDNSTLDLTTSPLNFVELLAFSNNVIRENAPGKKIISGSTTAINQNFSETLEYNRDMFTGGATQFIDVWGIHYYGKQFENVIRGGGVEEFLDNIGVPIWVTESGEQGVNNQLAYGEQVWPFLIDEIDGLERIYVYQFTEDTPPDSTYGLRNTSTSAPASDLYVYLRDRP